MKRKKAQEKDGTIEFIVEYGTTPTCWFQHGKPKSTKSNAKRAALYFRSIRTYEGYLYRIRRVESKVVWEG